MLGEANGVAASSVQSGVRITAAGLLTWADLNTNIALGDGYYSTLPGAARSKALRIKNHVALLLAQLVVPQQAAFALGTGHRLFCPSPTSDLPQSMVHLPCLQRPRGQRLRDWCRRADSELTATAYRRVAMRLLLWLQYDCQGQSLW